MLTHVLLFALAGSWGDVQTLAGEYQVGLAAAAALAAANSSSCIVNKTCITTLPPLRCLLQSSSTVV
jgi:hypothetical protein